MTNTSNCGCSSGTAAASGAGPTGDAPTTEAAGETCSITPAPRKPYKLLTGPDDSEFCAKVSKHLNEGYVLHGSPSITFNGTSVIAAQAVVLPACDDCECC